MPATDVIRTSARRQIDAVLRRAGRVQVCNHTDDAGPDAVGDARAIGRYTIKSIRRNRRREAGRPGTPAYAGEVWDFDTGYGVTFRVYCPAGEGR